MYTLFVTQICMYVVTILACFFGGMKTQNTRYNTRHRATMEFMLQAIIVTDFVFNAITSN